MSNIKVLRESKLEYELQPEGKARRSKCKTILLGIMYGMGPKTLAERINEPINDANKIIKITDFNFHMFIKK